MTAMANPVAEAQGFVSDYLTDDVLPTDRHVITNEHELDRAARIMQALLDRYGLPEFDGRIGRLVDAITDARARVTYLECVVHGLHVNVGGCGHWSPDECTTALTDLLRCPR